VRGDNYILITLLVLADISIVVSSFDDDINGSQIPANSKN